MVTLLKICNERSEAYFLVEVFLGRGYYLANLALYIVSQVCLTGCKKTAEVKYS